MAMTSLSVVFSVFVLHIHHRGSHNIRAPVWLRSFAFHYLAPALCVVTSSDYERKCFNDVSCWTSRRTWSNAYANGVTPTQYAWNHSSQRSASTGSRQNSSQHRRSNAAHVTYNDYRPITKQHQDTSDNHDDVTLTADMTSSRNDCLQHQLLAHLQTQAARQARDDAAEHVRREWHDVSAVIDRLLFVVFFVVTVLSTVGILIVQPTFKDVKLEDAILAASHKH